MFSAQEWLEEFEAVANSTGQGRASAGLRAAVARLDQQCDEMEMDPVAFRLSKAECRRRRRLVDELKGQFEPAHVYGGGTFVRPDHAGAAQTIAQQRAQAQAVVEEQDVLLDEILHGVDRLHDRAKTIGEESTLHTRLITEIDGDVEQATTGLHRETKHADRIRERSGNCHLYACIGVLSVTLLLLLITGFS